MLVLAWFIFVTRCGSIFYRIRQKWASKIRFLQSSTLPTETSFDASKEVRFQQKKSKFFLLFNLRYGVWPGNQSAEPAAGRVSRGVLYRHCHLSVWWGWRHHISVQQRPGHEGAHRSRWLCAACWKPGLSQLQIKKGKGKKGVKNSHI